MHNTNRQPNMLFLRIVTVSLLIVSTLLFAPATLADSQKQLIGLWTGAMTTNGTTMGVDLTVNSLQVNQNSGKIHFGSPRKCNINIFYIKNSGNDYHFALNEPNGGYCTKLIDGRLKLQLKGSNTLEFAVTPVKEGVNSDQGELSRSSN